MQIAIVLVSRVNVIGHLPQGSMEDEAKHLLEQLNKAPIDTNVSHAHGECTAFGTCSADTMLRSLDQTESAPTLVVYTSKDNTINLRGVSIAGLADLSKSTTSFAIEQSTNIDNAERALAAAVHDNICTRSNFGSSYVVLLGMTSPLVPVITAAHRAPAVLCMFANDIDHETQFNAPSALVQKLSWCNNSERANVDSACNAHKDALQQCNHVLVLSCAKSAHKGLEEARSVAQRLCSSMHIDGASVDVMLPTGDELCEHDEKNRTDVQHWSKPCAQHEQWNNDEPLLSGSAFHLYSTYPAENGAA